MLWLNVFQCHCYCTIADFIKNTQNVQPALSVYYISQSKLKQADDMKFLINTNKRPLLRQVTVFLTNV